MCYLVFFETQFHKGGIVRLSEVISLLVLLQHWVRFNHLPRIVQNLMETAPRGRTSPIWLKSFNSDGVVFHSRCIAKVSVKDFFELTCNKCVDGVTSYEWTVKEMEYF